MDYIEVDVEGGGNSDLSMTRMYEPLEESREVRWVEAAFRPDGWEGPCDVTGWSSGGPVPAKAAKVTDSGDGVVVPPFGLFGAQDGLPHHYKIATNGTDRVLGSKEVGVVVHPGDHIICLSSGGGGYGSPQNRDADAAEWDLKNGYATE